MKLLRMIVAIGLCTMALYAQAPGRAIQVKPANQVDAHGEHRVALVIGNSTYQSVASLQNAKADAQAMAAALNQTGFQVTLKLDQTEKGMKAALRTFKGQLRGGDVAVFYFSGHGVQLGGANYLLPVDIHSEDEDQVKDDALPLQRVLDDLQDQRTKFALAIVDACRNNPFKGAGRSIGGRGLAPTSAASGQMVLFSAGTGQEALDHLGSNDHNPNGLFTRVLLKEMRRPGLRVDLVMHNVRDEVVKLAKSIGHEQMPAVYDQAIGEFYFVPSTASVSAEANVAEAALPPPPVAVSQVGGLQVIVNAPDSQVYVDGVLKGTASPTSALNVTDLPVGGATLRVESPGHKTQEQAIEIQQGKWLQVKLVLTKTLNLTLSSAPAVASTQDITIAHVYDRSGPLAAYAKQTQTGLMMGLNYGTKGTMMINGHKLVVIEKDDQGKPDVGKALLTTAFADDKADLAVGATSSGVALAMLPVAEEYKKILLVEPAVADSITGDKWNRYIFRTGRNSSQDAISNAVALDMPGVSIATLAQDYAFGRDFIRAFRGALKHAHLVHEEYLPANTTDFTAGAQRLFDSLKNLPGRKIIFINWAGAGNPFKIADLDPKRYGIEIATGGNILPALAAYKPFPGMEGSAYYYYEIPKNPINKWLVEEHFKEFKAPPDFFTAGGMSAGLALVEALKRTGGNTSTEMLISTMEGMSFETPKGKMIFRKEDHQALQTMYHFRIKVDPNVAWAVPELVDEIKISDMAIPILNKR